MAEELIISISGLRGIVGENLTSEIATNYGRAFGTYLKIASSVPASYGVVLSVCIGRDSRPSGEMLSLAMAEGLCSVGIDVIDLGLVSTPGVGIMTSQLRCDGGVVITASHNPAQYNGIKVLSSGGFAFPADQANRIRECYFSGEYDLADPSACGRIMTNGLTHLTHIAKTLAIVDAKAIAAKKFKVVLDSVNGAGACGGIGLLTELGCKVIAVNDQPTGDFAHTPEPTRENLTDLCRQVTAAGADIGFAQDPDADRLAIVDGAGRYIGEEYTLALAAKQVFAHTKGTAAANLSTSRMIDDIASEAGCEVIRTAVGEANVAEAMIKNNCVIGGEGNGGVIDLRVSGVRDSFVAMALVLQLMAETGKGVGQLASEIGGYYMDKTKIKADRAQAALIIAAAQKAFAHARIDTTDGCRFDFDDGWLHLRVSNTEPVMRIIVETKTEQAAKKYLAEITQIRGKI